VTLLRAADICLSFGSRTVFHRLTLTIEEGERVGLVGVNGSGKSTLMKILAGAIRPDEGELQLRRGLQVTYLPQEPEFPAGATAASELAVTPPLKAAISAHAALAKRLEHSPSSEHSSLLGQMGQLSDEIERLGGWDTEHHAKTLLDRLGVKEWERPVSQLSGGLKKRVAIARALLFRPQLLLLDEPTNHLDADTTEWLEEELEAFSGALLLVTHDRYFLDGLVDRIVEIGPSGGLTSYPGNYQAYLEQKLVALQEAETKQHKRERWMAQEIAWLRKGVEARRTKSKARIERARKLLSERGFQPPRVAELQLAAAPRLGHTVVEAEKLCKRFGAKTIFEDVSLLVQGGERLGIVGPNGAGKTTLVRTLVGELEPDGGNRVLGKNTRIGYYDQSRAALDPEQTVYEAASSEEQVEISGRRIALRDYLDDLLFPVPMQRMKVGALSGGERNRLLLARLFLQGANLLVLDEPTNDLDIVTLNVLERLLLSFSGSVLLVTHDRYFLDKVATAILAFDGQGHVTRYPGNYSLYRKLAVNAAPAASPRLEKGASAPAKASAAKPARLGYKEKRELEGMEAAIAEAEQRKAELEKALADPEQFSQAAQVQKLSSELEEVSRKIDALYARWEQLESLASGTA
jgi:ATP-binding cassette subfamily F protein uup